MDAKYVDGETHFFSSITGRMVGGIGGGGSGGGGGGGSAAAGVGEARQEGRDEAVLGQGARVDAAAREAVGQRGEAAQGAVGDVAVLVLQQRRQRVHAARQAGVVRLHLRPETRRGHNQETQQQKQTPSWFSLQFYHI